MTLIFEVGPPFQVRPGRFKSRVMTRIWWGWFAIAILHIPLIEYHDSRRFEWQRREGVRDDFVDKFEAFAEWAERSGGFRIT